MNNSQQHTTSMESLAQHAFEIFYFPHNYFFSAFSEWLWHGESLQQHSTLIIFDENQQSTPHNAVFSLKFDLPNTTHHNRHLLSVSLTIDNNEIMFEDSSSVAELNSILLNSSISTFIDTKPNKQKTSKI